MTEPVFSEKKYIAIETAVGCAINGAISYGFVLAAFSGLELISAKQLIADAAPQSFAIAFFASFVPTLLTRKRLAKNVIPSLGDRPSRLPRNVFFRGITFALCGLVMGVAGHALVLTAMNIESISFQTVLVYKPVYGALLSLLFSPIALHFALREGLPTSGEDGQ